MLLEGLFARVLLPFVEVLPLLLLRPLLVWVEKAGPRRGFAAGPKEGPVGRLLPAVGEGLGDGVEGSEGQVHYCYMLSLSRISGVYVYGVAQQTSQPGVCGLVWCCERLADTRTAWAALVNRHTFEWWVRARSTPCCKSVSQYQARD